MNNRDHLRTIGPLFILLAALTLSTRAEPRQSAMSPDELVRTVASLDRAVFDAYNQCDLEKFAEFFIDDVEFFHDQTGVAHGKQNLVDSMRENICGEVRRELVPETLEVYPMHGYGALEMGVHLFHHPGRDDTEPTGQGKFVHLWQNKNGVWKITRVISYDHHALAK